MTAEQKDKFAHIQDQAIGVLRGLLYTVASAAVALLCWIALSALDELRGIKGEMKQLNDQMIVVVRDQKWQADGMEQFKNYLQIHDAKITDLDKRLAVLESRKK